MIFYDSVSSGACLSASRKRPQRQTFVCRFFLFRADRPSNSSAAPCRNKKRQCLRPLSLRGSPLMGVAWPNKGYFLICGHAKALPFESLSLRNTSKSRTSGSAFFVYKPLGNFVSVGAYIRKSASDEDRRGFCAVLQGPPRQAAGKRRMKSG